MSAEGVLERNLERLFARAYAPVRASESFRARLSRDLAQRIALRKESPRLAWRAAAAILLGLGVVFAAWRFVRLSPGAVDVERLLAEGSAALREGPALTWRALSDEEVLSGVRYEGLSLEVATPREVEARVLLGAAGELDVGSLSRVRVEGPGGESGLLVSLESGSVSAERHGAGEAWRLRTEEGSVRLGGGVLEIACLDLRGLPATRALLRAGSASVAMDPPAPLAPGEEVWLQDGARVATATLESPGAGPRSRTEAGTVAEPESTAPESTEAPSCSLRGALTLPADASKPGSYLVTLLRRERLPEVSQADPHSFQDPTFAIDGLEPGSYSVFVEVAGYAVWRRIGIDLVAGSPPVVLEVGVDSGASLRGRVLDPEGRPVEGASVLSETDVPSQLLPFSLAEVSAKWIACATSQADGTFELRHLSRARHRLRASHAGLGAVWSDPVDLALATPSGAVDLTLRLVPPAAIEGTVARDDGTPWPGAVVVASLMDTESTRPDRGCLHFSTAVADLRGHFAVEDLPPGQFVILNVLEGQQGGGGRVPRVQTVHVEPGVRARVDLPGGVLGTSLAGTLLDSDGAPLADLDVTLVPGQAEDGDWKSTRSRADGRFDFPSLPPGTYTIFVGGDLGQQLAFQGVLEVPAVPIFEQTVRVGAGVLRGRVLDDKTGAGLPNCAVVLEVETPRGPTFAGRSVTDGQGGYLLPRLPPGRFRATAYSGALRYGQETVDGITIGEGGSETSLDLRLRPGSGLLVRVVDAGGRAIAGAKLRFREEGRTDYSFSPEDRADGSGRFRIHGLKPGRWTIRASADLFEDTSTTIDLVVDEERSVEITLPSPR